MREATVDSLSDGTKSCDVNRQVCGTVESSTCGNVVSDVVSIADRMAR